MCGRNTIRIFELTIGRSKYISLLLKVNSLRYEYICCYFVLYSCFVMKHPNDALRIAIGIGGMRIVDKELDMMDGYEFMKVINGCSTDNDKISKV